MLEVEVFLANCDVSDKRRHTGSSHCLEVRHPSNQQPTAPMCQDDGVAVKACCFRMLPLARHPRLPVLFGNLIWQPHGWTMTRTAAQ